MLGAGLDPRDDALDPAPAAGGVVELRKAPHFAARRCRSEPFGSGFLQRLDMAAQHGHRNYIEDAEEALLRTQFGAEYDAYRARTSRLIPGLY